MTSQLTTALILLTIVLVGGRYAKAISNTREETKRTEVEAKKLVSLSQEETKRTRAIARTAKNHLQRRRSSKGSPEPPMSDQEIADHERMKYLGESHLEPLYMACFEKQRKLQFEDIIRNLSPGSPPRAIEVEPEPTREVEMDGMFLILRLHSGNQRDGYRAEVQRDDGLEALVDISDTETSPDEKSILQKSEWEKAPLYMRINLKIQRMKVISAKLLHTATSEPSSPDPTMRQKYNKLLPSLPSNQTTDDYSRSTLRLFPSPPPPTNYSHPQPPQLPPTPPRTNGSNP